MWYQDKMIHCVKQIWEGGICEYWYTKSITKPEFEPHISLKQDILQRFPSCHLKDDGHSYLIL